MKRWWWMSGLVALLSVGVARADLVSTLDSVWQKILGVGYLSFLHGGSAVVGFTRIMIWILCFTIFFAVQGMKIKDKPIVPFSRNQGMVVAFVVATIAAVFMPASVLLATGTGWSTAVALLLIGGPIVGIGYLMWSLPGEDSATKKPFPETRGHVVIKLLACALMLWILTAMKYHVGGFS